MPNSTIEINNNNISPWNRVDKHSFNYNMSILTQNFKQNERIKKYLEDYLNQNDIRNFNLNRDFFPPDEEKFHRIWNNYIFPDNQYVFIGIPDSFNFRSTIELLSSKILFHKFYKDKIKLQNEDIYVYAYCVILAGLNILSNIFNTSSINNIYYHPISYLCFDDSGITNCTCSMQGSLYKASIYVDTFFNLIEKVPIPDDTGETSVSYSNFWHQLWLIYYNSKFQPTKKNNPSLTDEYINRYQNKENISKQHIISMIENSRLSNDTLNSIYNIINNL